MPNNTAVHIVRARERALLPHLFVNGTLISFLCVIEYCAEFYGIAKCGVLLRKYNVENQIRVIRISHPTSIAT